MRIGIIGTGVAGLVVAERLHRRHDITVYEAEPRIGGHAHTVDVEVDGRQLAVDVGFIVYNEVTYPGLVSLFARYGVATQPSEMSFSVSDAASGIEWSGRRASTFFVGPRDLARPRLWRLLRDIVGFNAAARALLESGDDPTLDDFLDAGPWHRDLRDLYVTPLGSSIWSADPRRFGEYPARTLFTFLANHGLLRVSGRPTWRTVAGGSRHYLHRITAGFADRIRTKCAVRQVRRHDDHCEVRTAGGTDRFDHVVIATHSDQALGLLADPTPAEREVLGGIRYRPNSALLHTDRRLLPRQQRAWSSWNFHRPVSEGDRPTLTYLMNRLQSLPVETPVSVTLNRDDEIDPARVLGRFSFTHPVYDRAAVAAQARKHEICGAHRTWFAGAYWGYGFHEDGLRSGVDVGERLEAVA